MLFLCHRVTKEDGLSTCKTSRINLVDLAGSEQQKLTGAAGPRLKQTGNISRSLSQLGYGETYLFIVFNVKVHFCYSLPIGQYCCMDKSAKNIYEQLGLIWHSTYLSSQWCHHDWSIHLQNYFSNPIDSEYWFRMGGLISFL